VAVSLGMLARQSQGAGEKKFVIVCCFIFLLTGRRGLRDGRGLP
jgi:hypothetical protein